MKCTVMQAWINECIDFRATQRKHKTLVLFSLSTGSTAAAWKTGHFVINRKFEPEGKHASHKFTITMKFTTKCCHRVPYRNYINSTLFLVQNTALRLEICFLLPNYHCSCQRGRQNICFSRDITVRLRKNSKSQEQYGSGQAGHCHDITSKIFQLS